MAQRYNTGNPRPSNSMKDLNDNALANDDYMNSEADTFIDRLGDERDTLRGSTKKMLAAGAAVVEETRQNLIPLSRQYMTLAAAQADIANIPDGSATYVRSADGSSLADEYINNAGTLEATGRKMPSQGSVDALKEIISEEIAKVMASGAAQTTDAYPDIAELILDSVGHAVYRRYADGTSQFPALMIGLGVELVQIAGGGFVCQLRDTQEEIFKVSASGSIIRGTVTSWITDDESISDYVEIHMDG
ncbi:TPA: hypothetical protein ACXRZJ_005333, partial [Klebsiella quasipneumoniae subsp. similipneumoniae]